MKNIILITEDGEQLISSTDDGTNQLIINDTVIPSADWVGTGTYTDTIHGHSISIDKAPDLDGIIQLVKLSPYNYALKKAKTQQGLYPVGSVYITKTNTNPSTFLGGEWSLVDKDFKFKWITSGFTFDTANTQNGAFVAIPNDKTIELRFTFQNKVAISDNIFTIGTLNPLEIGITDGQLHAIYGQVNADGLNAIGLASLNWSNNVGTLDISDWVTRATAYPTTTGQGCQLSMILTAQTVTSMIDTFCDKFYWHRTA